MMKRTTILATAAAAQAVAPAAQVVLNATPQATTTTTTTAETARVISEVNSAPIDATPTIKDTALYPFHQEYKAQFIEFAGYHMPVRYAIHDSVGAEHLHTRSQAGLFDVSHMCQMSFYGADREKFLEYLTPADVSRLPANKSKLTMLLNEKGCLTDDCIVTRFENRTGLVVNAACAIKDLAHIRATMSAFGGDVHLDVHSDLALVALQGPKAKDVVEQLLGESLDKLLFMEARPATFGGDIHAMVSRSGYTGEDGFEISVPNAQIHRFCNMLMEAKSVKPIGLAARDSLRLEGGMCLYGNDLNDTINPVEASLIWTIAQSRRKNGGFLGYEAIQDVLQNPKLATRSRVGIKMIGRGPCPRDAKSEIKTANGVSIGHVTSGCPSPSLNYNIAMGYVKAEHAATGTKIMVAVNGGKREIEAEIVKIPFVEPKFHHKASMQ